MTNHQTNSAARERRGRVRFEPSLVRIHEMAAIEQGWEALEALDRLRWLTSWQVAKLLFLGRPNPSGAARGGEAARKAANARCLRRLKDRQLVEARQVILRQRPHWIRREYNVLTESGHRLLRDRKLAHGESPSDWDPTRSEIAPEALAHALAVNDVAIAFMRSCEHHGAALLAWIDDFAARAARGEVGFARFVPDAGALLERAGTRALYLIEADRGTEPVASEAANSWRTKMQRYRRYLADGFARDAFFAGAPTPLVLTVTTSPERLLSLMAETTHSGDRDRSWFTCAAWLEPPYDVLGAIWRRPHAPDAFSTLLDDLAARSA